MVGRWGGVGKATGKWHWPHVHLVSGKERVGHIPPLRHTLHYLINQYFSLSLCYLARSQSCDKRLRHVWLSVRPSARPHGTTRFPLDGFSWNLTFECFSKIFWQNSTFMKTWQVQPALYMQQTDTHFWPYLAQFFSEWGMLHTKVVEKTKTHILCSVISFRKSCRLWDNVEKYCIAWLATDNNMTHAHCMLGNQGNEHKLRICNTSAVPLQQWLCERVSMLRYTYIACLSYLVPSHSIDWTNANSQHLHGSAAELLTSLNTAVVECGPKWNGDWPGENLGGKKKQATIDCVSRRDSPQVWTQNWTHALLSSNTKFTQHFLIDPWSPIAVSRTGNGK